MDKNTLLGLLLMGGVILGFMWLNQPSAEEIERRRQEAQAELLAAQQQAVEQQVALIADTLSPTEMALIAPTIKQYGVADSMGGYVISNSNVNLRLNGDAVSGTINVEDTTINVADVLSKKLDNVMPKVASKAVATLKSTINSFSKYQEFAQYLTGDSATVKLENELLALDISTKGGAISRAELKQYLSYDSTNVVLFENETNDFNFTLTTLNQRLETRNFYFTPVHESDTTVLMSLDLGKGAKFGIRYTLLPDSYIVKMDVVQENMQAIIPMSTSSMDLHWYQKMSRHEKGRTFEERNSTVCFKYAGDAVEELSAQGEDTEEVSDRIKWIGFKNQFFSSVIIAKNNFTGAKLQSKDLKETTQKTFLKDMTADASMEYSSASPIAASFDLFLGPNLYPLLSDYDEQLSADEEDLELTKLIPLGWTLFRWINTIIIIPVFTFLGGFIENYGIIILLLTLFIKIILFPFTYKSYMSQAKMRVLAPEIKEINDKYPGKENAMVRQQKTMELYSKAGASPFSGCLPMLLQMPILIAMFTFFPSCIELRGESFLWAKDLSAPDAIFSWDVQIPFISSTFGNHVSLFCLLMTVTNIIYTRINMQNQAQTSSMPGMKMMMYLMPVMFLFFFNDYASGLSYYYFLSLLITIIQTYSFRFIVDEEKVRAQMKENAKKPRKKSGFMARLEEAQRQQQAMLREQEKRKKGGKR